MYKFHIRILITDSISSISAVPAKGNVGDSQDVICILASTTGLDPKSTVFSSWTGPNGIITDDDRVTINVTLDNNIYTTILHFDYLSENDEGIYTCNMITSDHTLSLNFSITSLTSKSH